jgi:hypothetical protein
MKQVTKQVASYLSPIVYSVLLLYAVPGGVWADEGPSLSIDRYGEIRLIPGGETEHALWCVDQLEAAMRAMEPFTPRLLPVTNGTTFVTPGPVPAPRYGEAYDAATLWEQAKADCWRKDVP